jgi:putative transposase
VLHEDRFVDLAPGEVHAILLDEGRYLCSESTMYRLLRETHGGVRERRRQATHPPRVKPELVAHGPNQCWSWDITKLTGPAKWTYYYLYSIIDIYSRYTVGWMVATRESKELAERLLGDTIAKQNIDRDQLTIHADRGSSMASKPVAFLLADLGVTKSHSRPHCSNDNPFSEAQFKTLKYRPDFPQTFGSIEDARTFCARFYRWYNHDSIPASGCTRHSTFITATQTSSTKPGPPPSASPTRPTPNDSSASIPSPRNCPAPPGSTDPNQIHSPDQQTDPTRLTGSAGARRQTRSVA